MTSAPTPTTGSTSQEVAERNKLPEQGGGGFRCLSANKEHKLKSPLCPYCGGGLSFSINGCELDSDSGTGWFATELDINCDTEPDIDGPQWEGWWENHSWDYCNKWHEVHDMLVRHFKRTHRVPMDNGK